jgi:hypothetical protein
MIEAPPTSARSGLQRALAVALIACVALSAWTIVQTHRPTSGLKRAPAPAPQKPPPRERTNWSLDPEPLCLQARSVTLATNDA